MPHSPDLAALNQHISPSFSTGREFPVSKGLPSNTNTKFLFVWAEGRGESLHRAGRNVAGPGILQLAAAEGLLSAQLAARDQEKSCSQPDWSFPLQIRREILGIFVSTESQSHFTYRLSTAPCQTGGGERGVEGRSWHVISLSDAADAAAGFMRGSCKENTSSSRAINCF